MVGMKGGREGVWVGESVCTDEFQVVFLVLERIEVRKRLPSGVTVGREIPLGYV